MILGSLPSSRLSTSGGRGAGATATKKKKERSDITHRENRTDEDSVVRPERLSVRGGERGGEFLRLVGLGALQSLAGKREAAEEPHQAFGGGSLLLVLFVLNELLEGRREGGSSIVSGTDFL